MKIGLINGLSGDALLLFLSPENKNNDEGLELLNIISEEITTSVDYSFETGITGFGWLVAFLHQEKLIDIDSDDILEDFDDQIYKVTLQRLSEQNADTNALLDLIDYHIIRHRNKNFNEKHFRKFLHQECINLMVEKLNTIIDYYISQKELTQTQIENSCKILLKFSYLSHYINNKIISERLPDLLYYFIKYIENNLQPDSNLKKQYQEKLWLVAKNKNYRLFITQLETALPKYSKLNLKETTDIENIIYQLTNVIN